MNANIKLVVIIKKNINKTFKSSKITSFIDSDWTNDINDKQYVHVLSLSMPLRQYHGSVVNKEVLRLIQQNVIA